MSAKPSSGPPAMRTTVPNLSPARLHTIIAGLWFCLFLSALDTTIVTTALIKISSGFNALQQAAWLITTYLLTYNSACSHEMLHILRLTTNRFLDDHGKVQ